jgi:hypothetical protein
MVTAGKHVNNARTIARLPPVTALEGLLKVVFHWVRPRPAEAVQLSEVKYLVGEWESTVEGWQLSGVLPGRLIRDGAIVDSWQEFSCGIFTGQ